MSVRSESSEKNKYLQKEHQKMKGKTNNPNGRPKGVPNKISSDIKNFLKEVIVMNMSKIKKDIKELEPKDRLMILEKFMSYIIPKQKAVDISGEIHEEVKPKTSQEEEDTLLLECVPADKIADIALILQEAEYERRQKLLESSQ